MDERFDKINKLLSEYSLGNFHKKLALSHRMDEVDAFVAGVNMLGEELKDRTISRDYFNNIFDSVSDLVFVLNKQGKIQDVNKTVVNTLKYSHDYLRGKSINSVLAKEQPGWFNQIINDARTGKKSGREAFLKTKSRSVIPVLVSVSFFMGGNRVGEKLLVTAKDISVQKEAENRVLKAIIETEEQERMRFAQDIHDSIGQQLSAIKFYIGTSASAVTDARQKEILLKANAALLEVQADMRDICFNIMPKSLEIFGLVKAVKELVGKNSILDHIHIIIREEDGFPRLPVKEEFALFRIIQEFLNNTLKHSRATTVRIDFSRNRDKILIQLSDNGIGFDPARLKKHGMGLNNVTSRLRPYHGEVNIISRPGKGTRYEIALPLHSKK